MKYINNAEFLKSLKDEVKSQGGIAKLAKISGLSRESLYKTLSSKGNPRFSTLYSILDALDIKLTLTRSEI